jgi:hypothetical protein
MNTNSDKNARLSRDVQAKIGEKLALLYLPVLRQDLPRQLSELSRRLAQSDPPQAERRSRMAQALERLRRRGQRR